jgi:hypothetical protein
MYKLFIIIGVLTGFGLFTNSILAQETSYFADQVDIKKYEFTFSSVDYEKVKPISAYIGNITAAEKVLFEDDSFKVIVFTSKELEYNIIYGKFEKKEIEMVSFKKQ